MAHESFEDQQVANLKKIYTAVTLDEAEENLRTFSNTWRKQYLSCVKNWEDNWKVLPAFHSVMS